MTLHLGGGYSVNKAHVIGVFDIEKASTSRDTREYLARAGRHKHVVSCTDDLPKSFVVSLDKDLTETVYICGTAKNTDNFVIYSHLYTNCNLGGQYFEGSERTERV